MIKVTACYIRTGLVTQAYVDTPDKACCLISLCLLLNEGVDISYVVLNKDVDSSSVSGGGKEGDCT
jgi:hypothetical protein